MRIDWSPLKIGWTIVSIVGFIIRVRRVRYFLRRRRRVKGFSRDRSFLILVDKSVRNEYVRAIKMGFYVLAGFTSLLVPPPPRIDKYGLKQVWESMIGIGFMGECVLITWDAWKDEVDQEILEHLELLKSESIHTLRGIKAKEYQPE